MFSNCMWIQTDDVKDLNYLVIAKINLSISKYYKPLIFYFKCNDF